MEKEILTSKEAYEKRYIHPAKTEKEESTHFCYFDSGYTDGEKNGQLKEREKESIAIKLYTELNQFTKQVVDLLEMYTDNPSSIPIEDRNKAIELVDSFNEHWQDGL